MVVYFSIVLDSVCTAKRLLVPKEFYKQDPGNVNLLEYIREYIRNYYKDIGYQVGSIQFH